MQTEGKDERPFSGVYDLLERLRTFEREAHPGFGRIVFSAFLSELFNDGSGMLCVKFSSTQNATPEQTLFSRLFTSSKSFKFDSLADLRSLLDDPKLLITTHPEIEEA